MWTLGKFAAIFYVLLRETLPSQDHLILASRIGRERSRPLPLQDRDVLFLLLALFIAVCASTTSIGIVLNGKSHAITTQDRAMRFQVGASEVIVFFQCHLWVEEDFRFAVDNEE